jgi:hypothetical protein
MNANENRNLLGRAVALALIVGAVYGVRAINNGGLGCPLGDHSCCAMAIPQAESDDAAKPVAPAVKPK